MLVSMRPSVECPMISGSPSTRTKTAGSGRSSASAVSTAPTASAIAGTEASMSDTTSTIDVSGLKGSLASSIRSLTFSTVASGSPTGSNRSPLGWSVAVPSAASVTECACGSRGTDVDAAHADARLDVGHVDARPNGQHRRFASHSVAAQSGFERALKVVGRQKVGRSRGCGACAFDGSVDAALVHAVEMGEAVESDAGIDDVGVVEQFAGGEFDDERPDEVVERAPGHR